MKIVVLDGYTLNPGDLSWQGFEDLGTLEVYDRTEPSLILKRAQDAALLLTNKTPLTAETLKQLKSLRYIGVLATGYNVVDVKAAKELGIPVANIPTYGTASVAQFAFALLLELCHNVRLHADAVRAGEWTSNKDWCFWKSPLIELAGKTMGIVGFGRIGREVGAIAHAMGMRVLAHDAVRTNPPNYDGFRWVSLEEILKESDVVSLHCPLFPETHGLINTQRLALMKPTAFLLNNSRGPLIVDQDLADALNSGKIAGAAVDVLSVEPPPANNPLLSAKNCLVTPHISWATKEARTRLMGLAVENAKAFLAGKPQNIVNP
jgi:glycerate dehydrogenase